MRALGPQAQFGIRLQNAGASPPATLATSPLWPPVRLRRHFPAPARTFAGVAASRGLAVTFAIVSPFKLQQQRTRILHCLQPTGPSQIADPRCQGLGVRMECGRLRV